jgi:hypothetical protein
MAGPAAQEEVGSWVDAAPFRAQLHHLMGSTAMTLDEVAAAAGISVRLARHLAYGRNGRALRRVSPETGRRLMALSVPQLRRLRRTQLEVGVGAEVGGRRVGSRRLAVEDGYAA